MFMGTLITFVGGKNDTHTHTHKLSQKNRFRKKKRRITNDQEHLLFQLGWNGCARQRYYNISYIFFCCTKLHIYCQFFIVLFFLFLLISCACNLQHLFSLSRAQCDVIAYMFLSNVKKNTCVWVQEGEKETAGKKDYEKLGDNFNNRSYFHLPT